MQYGSLPAPPDKVQCQLLHSAIIAPMHSAQLHTYRIQVFGQDACQFVLRLWLPHPVNSAKPCPVILNGDGCWPYATDAVVSEILRRHYALAQFNRVEIAADIPINAAQTHQPAIAAWAWGFHRCVDALTQLEAIDASRIAVVGHSRGGKAALLAGATDERIALTSANNSGAAGAGCYRWLGEGAEKLGDILRNFPHWLSPNLNAFVGQENSLPFDQHFLKALIAPRALLTTEALDDLWANPQGSWQTHLAAQEVYRFTDASQRIAIGWRAGQHGHTLADWCALLDFADQQFHGVMPASSALANPFTDLPRAFSWSSPALT